MDAAAYWRMPRGRWEVLLREGQVWWNWGGSFPGEPNLRVMGGWLADEEEKEVLEGKAAVGLTAP